MVGMGIGCMVVIMTVFVTMRMIVCVVMRVIVLMGMIMAMNWRPFDAVLAAEFLVAA